MNKYLASALMMGVAAFAACTQVDPDYSDFNTVVVETANGSITGVVTSLDASPVSGAVVTIGDKTAETDTEGAYVINDLPLGTYEVSVSAAGKNSASKTVTMENSKVVNTSCNFSLSATENVLKVASGNSASLTTEAIASTAAVTVSAKVPEGALPSGVDLVVEPVYDSKPVVVTKSSNKIELEYAKFNVSRSDGSSVAAAKPVDLTIEISESIVKYAKVKVDGNAMFGTEYSLDGNKIIVEDYHLFGLISIVVEYDLEIQSGTTAMKVQVPDDKNLDNRYGQNLVKIQKVECEYKTGAEIKSSDTDELRQAFSMIFSNTVKTVKATINTEINVPVGYSASISGSQAVDHVTLKDEDGKTLKGDVYNTASINVSFTGRNHSGGSN